MRKGKKCIALLLCMLLLCAVGIPVSADTIFSYKIGADAPWLTKNPLGARNAGDPYVLKTSGGEYYCYATSSINGFAVWKTEDFRKWEYCGTAYEPPADGWANEKFWAPEVVEYENKFYMFYSAARDNTYQSMRLGLAVSDSPVGPFADIANEPYLDFGYAMIDANVLILENGEKYLYYSRDGSDNLVDGNCESQIWGVKLKDDFSGADGEPVLLLRPDCEWEKATASWNQLWTEAPEAFYRDGTYYLMYSGNTAAYYSVGYAMSDNPLGPFAKAEVNPILAHAPGVVGPGHHSVFLSPDDRELWACYQVDDAPSRILCVDKFGFRADGTLYTNGPTQSLQLVPSGTNGYTNAAADAVLSGSEDFSAAILPLLNDGEISTPNRTQTVAWQGSGTTGAPYLEMTLAQKSNLCGLLLYGNGTQLTVKRIVLDDTNIIENVTVPAAPGEAAVISFNTVQAKKIRFEFDSVSSASLSEIQAVAEKGTGCAAHTQAYAAFFTPGTVRGSSQAAGFTGYVGMQFTVGSEPVTVTELGRIFLAGNTRAHEVCLVDAQTGAVLGEVTVSGGTADKFTYAALNNPVILEAGKTYYLASSEELDGDNWYHSNSGVSFSHVASCDGPVYSADGVQWGKDTGAGMVYGPVSFRYLVPEKAAIETKEETESGASSGASQSVPSDVSMNSPSTGDASQGVSLFGALSVLAAAVLVSAVMLLFFLRKRKA